MQSTSHASSLRPDVWQSNPDRVAVHFQLATEAETDVLCRVLNLFAMQYLLPAMVSSRQVGPGLLMEIHVEAIAWHRAQVIAEKMRSLIHVEQVELRLLERWQACG